MKAVKKEFAELEPAEQAKRKQNTFQRRLLRAIESVEVRCAMIVIPRIVLDLCEGDLPRATMLSHLIYLCDKGDRKDGWVWKSWREWTKETGLRRVKLTTAAEWLKDQELLEVKNIRAHGHPTLHYRLNQGALVRAIGQHVADRLREEIAKTPNHPHPEWPEQYRGIFLKEVNYRR